MKNYFSITKKGLLVMLFGFFCVGFICCQIAAVSNTNPNAATNADRLIFIKNLGLSVTDDSPVVKTVNVPEVFYDVYNNYNVLQKKAGYDLSLYKGCEVMIYTYKIASPQNSADNCVVNLMVYKDRIIGGDISSVALGGVMLPLKRVID